MRASYEPTEARDLLYGFLGARFPTRFNANREGGQYALLTSYPIPQLALTGRLDRFVLLSIFFACLMVANWRFIANRSSPITTFVAYVSTLVVGGFLVQAMSTVLIVRYLQPLEGLIIVTIASGLWVAGVFAIRRAMPLAYRFRSWPSTLGDP